MRTLPWQGSSELLPYLTSRAAANLQIMDNMETHTRFVHFISEANFSGVNFRRCAPMCWEPSTDILPRIVSRAFTHPKVVHSQAGAIVLGIE